MAGSTSMLFTRPGGTIGTAAGSKMTPLYWDAVLGESLYPSLYFYQFAAKRRVPPNFGMTIKIPRLKRQTGIVGAVTCGYYGIPLTSFNNSARMGALCAEVVSGTFVKYAGVYNNSDIALLTTMGDVTELAVRDLARDLALQIDTGIRTGALCAAGNGLWLATSAGATGQITATSGSLKATAAGAGKVTPSGIARMVATLQNSLNPRWPDGTYPLLLHPMAMLDLQTTLSSGYAGAWQDFHRYTENSVDALYKGEVGRLFGARIISAPNVKRLPAAVGGMSAGITTSSYQGYMFAPEAYYVAEMDQMTSRVIVKGLGSGGSYDPDNSLSTVAAKVFFSAFRGFQNTSLTPKEYRMVRLVHFPSVTI